MKKKLSLLTLIGGVVFMTSCKKDVNIEVPQLKDENQRVITNTPPQPIPVLSPTVFFVDMDTIWTIADIAAANPAVTKKSSILNISKSGALHENVFNFLPKFPNQTPNVIYNPFLDRLLSIDGKILSKCFTPSRTTSTTVLPNSTFGVSLKIKSTDKKLYYFSINPNLKKEIRSINMDGSGDVQVRPFLGVMGNSLNESFNGDISFSTNTLFAKNTNFNFIAKTDLTNPASALLPFVSPKTNETFAGSKIKYDDLHNKVFFSAKDPILKKVRIYSISATGDVNTLQKIIEMSYVDNTHTFTFDISPETNTLFWCKREFNANTKKHTSILTRTNLSGGNAKLLRTGNFINTVVVAIPAVNNG